MFVLIILGLSKRLKQIKYKQFLANDEDNTNNYF